METKNVIELIVQENDANQTIFNFIKKMFKTTSLSVIYKLFRNKKIKVNDIPMKDRSYKLLKNDKILIFDKNLIITNRFVEQKFIAKEMQLTVVYEDQNILIVDKPHGVEMHSNFHNSLDQMVRAYLISTKEYQPNYEQTFIVSHVHRLDKLTRGLVIYAKNKLTLDSLLMKINQKEYIQKKYLAKCEGEISSNSFALNGYLVKDEAKQLMVFTDKKIMSAKVVSTNFKVIVKKTNFTWVEAELITGRKHQIRASLSYLKHPVVNDVKYGAKRVSSAYMIFLYAVEISFHNLTDHLQYLNEKIIKITENIIK